LTVERVDVGGVEVWSCIEGSPQYTVTNYREAMLDTGSTLIGIPDDIVPDLRVFETPADCSFLLATPEAYPDLTIYIRSVAGGLVPYTLSVADYTIQDGGSCITGITRGAAGARGVAPHSTMILGDVFMRKFSPAFNFQSGENGGQVGFALANHDADRTS